MGTIPKADRKVIKLGDLFVVPLPNVWVKANNIKKGEQLECGIYPNKVVFRKKG